jgi:Regulator of G protein signaling domain
MQRGSHPREDANSKRWFARVFKRNEQSTEQQNISSSSSSYNNNLRHTSERKTSSPVAATGRRHHRVWRQNRAEPLLSSSPHDGVSTSSECSSPSTSAARAARPAPLVLRVFQTQSNADPPMIAFVSRRIQAPNGITGGLCAVRGLQDKQDMADARRIMQAAAPCLADIMSGASAAPYSLELFKLWAQVNLVSENLSFLTATAQLRCAPLSELTIRARALLASFVRLNSENEINLCDNTRRKVITIVTRVSAKLDRSLQARRAAAAKPGAFRRASYTIAAVSATRPQYAPYFDISSEQQQQEQQQQQQHNSSGSSSADESIMRLAQELKSAFAPAERQIYNLVSLDAHPRFVAAVTAALQRFAAGHAMLMQDEDLARTAVSLWRAAQLQQRERCSNTSTQPGSPADGIDSFAPKRRETLP